MTRNEKLYTSLCILFCMLIVVGNLTYQKFVFLSFPWVGRLELSVGAILYPLTFLITDLIAEFYSKEKANFCVRFALFTNVLVAIILAFMDSLPATNWSKIDDLAFHSMFKFYGVAFVGSIIACYISQAFDISLYLWIRRITKEKYLWLRNSVSTSVSLFIDAFIVITFLTFFEILPKEQMVVLIKNSYAWKLFFTICSIPLFYGVVSLVKKLMINHPLRIG